MRVFVFLLLACVGIQLGACSRPAGTIFPEAGPVWPPPPDAPRIRYLGQLSADSDLKPAKSGWAALGEALGGARPSRGLSTPAGIAISDDQQLYVTDPAQHAVHVFDLQSRAYRTITRAADQALFTPADVAIIGDQILVTDSALHAVFVYTREGHFLRSFGADRLKRPVGIACARIARDLGAGAAASAPAAPPSSPAAIRIYVVDTGAHACVVFDQAGIEQSRFGRRGAAPGDFNYPTYIAAIDGVGVTISDSLNFRVQRFTLDGQLIAALGQRGDGAGAFALPKGVAADDKGRTYVVDAQFENVQVFSSAGELLLAFGQEGRRAGEFWLPNGAALGRDGRLWVADGYNRRVQVFQVLGEPQ